MQTNISFSKFSGLPLKVKLVLPVLILAFILISHCMVKILDLSEKFDYAFFTTELLIVVFLWYMTYNRIQKPVSSLIASPELEPYIDLEIKKGELQHLTLVMYKLLNENKMASDFTRKIEEGNFAWSLQTEQKSSLFEALEVLQKKLKTLADEDKKRMWASEGLAHFVDILRSHNHNLDKLAEQLIASLVKTLKANQGGLFYLNTDVEDEPFLELLSCYAYDKKKYLTKRIEIGQGLTGQAVLEKDTIYMSEIPQGYLSITSGLGEATPKYLLIVPLKSNDNVEGVVELASFNPFEAHEIAFVEKLSESIASNISSMRINERNKKLLDESLQQAELLRQQEEEVRQNLEELTATQEEMERKGKEMEQLLADYMKKEEELSRRMKEIEANKKEIKSLTKISESSTMLMELIDLVPYPIFVKNEKQEYVMVNESQARLFSISKEELIGKTDADLVSDIYELEVINNTDRKVLSERIAFELPEQEITHSDGTRKVLVTHKIPFISEIDGTVNILGVSIDNTYKKIVEENMVE